MISVCIATHNGEKYIREQLLSILPQLGAEDEIIISDDASTDTTLKIISDLHDSRIHILHHTPYSKHHFIADKATHNFENALYNCHGDYIFLSDQDDIWLPNKVQIVLQALQSSELIIHDCQIVDANLHLINPSYLDYIHVHTGAFQNAIRCTYLGCCMAFKRCVLHAALPFPPTCVAHDQWIGIISALQFRTKILHLPLIQYRRHLQTQTNCGNTSTLHWWNQIYYKAIVIYYTILKAIKR